MNPSKSNRPKIPSDIALPNFPSYQVVDLELADGRILKDMFVNPEQEVCGQLVGYPDDLDEGCIDFACDDIIGLLPRSGFLAKLGLRRWRRRSE